MVSNLFATWINSKYAEKYGEEKLLDDFERFEKQTGREWLEVYLAALKDDKDYSLEELHKNIILKAIK